MADLRPFAGLSQEDTNAMMLMLLAQIADKLPRLDANDRVCINGNDIESLQVVTQIGTSGRQRPADLYNLAIPQMGALHIYNQIEVS